VIRRHTLLTRSQVTNKLLKDPIKLSKKTEIDGTPPPDTETLERLNQLATEKLAEIVRRGGARESGWTGYDAAEIEAARKLLAEDEPSQVR
jgi:ER membrane protein complex subunit 2